MRRFALHLAVPIALAFAVVEERPAQEPERGTGQANSLEWSSVAVPPSIGSRIGATSCFTGEELIVFGGRTADEYLATGARFDPARGVWRDLPSEGAPSRRAWHSAVWTGSEMIVWGGVGAGDNYHSDGARYDPRTNRWRALATDAAPTARCSHVALWCGDAMLVWAGTDESRSFPSGGRYDPVSDVWSPFECDVDALLPRSVEAVWTGRHMAVWGGINGGNVIGHGFRYELARNEWSAITQLDAPTARAAPVVAWHRERMIVLGGRSRIHGTDAADGGGRYDPLGDRWEPLGLELPRDAPIAAATTIDGVLHLVWSGSPASVDPPVPITVDSPDVRIMRGPALEVRLDHTLHAVDQTLLLWCAEAGHLWRLTLP